MSTLIDQLITSISNYQNNRLFNPCSQSCPNEISKKYYLQRRKNLIAHLSCPDPLCIIIGEAPGYRGARFTGVPFTKISPSQIDFFTSFFDVNTPHLDKNW